MRKCPNCLVEVKTNRKTCPLCGQLLTGDGSNLPTHPPYQPQSKHINLFLRITLFITIVAGLVSVLINILTYEGVMWAGYVILGLIYMWIIIKSTILSRRNIAKKLLIQMIALSLIVIGIENLSQTSGWALDYVVPSICGLSVIAIIILIVSKKMRYNDYLLYLITTILISFVPIILYWTDVVGVLWPSVTSATIGVITIVGMVIFADTATKDELKKRFHI
ncbi:MAG: DUF6320 domain-containing protein [Bacilli bacterium]|jgi:hypothetical protein|nr:DUF6320 domain-containing protein [Bacilli bacterium]